MLGLLVGKSSGGFQFIHFADRKASANGERLVPGITGLVEVEIAVCVRSHDDIMSHLCCFNTAYRSLPGHYDGIGCNVSVQYLIPADDAPSMRVEEVFGTLHTVALKTIFGGIAAPGFQSFIGNAFLTFGTLFPTGAGSFVTTNVYVFGGKYLYQFAQDVFHELHGLFVTDAEHIGKYAPVRTYFVGTTRAAKFRVGSQYGQCMSG